MQKQLSPSGRRVSWPRMYSEEGKRRERCSRPDYRGPSAGKYFQLASSHFTRGSWRRKQPERHGAVCLV